MRRAEKDESGSCPVCVCVYDWGRGRRDGLDVWTRRQRVVDCLPPAREFEAMR